MSPASPVASANAGTATTTAANSASIGATATRRRASCLCKPHADARRPASPQAKDLAKMMQQSSTKPGHVDL